MENPVVYPIFGYSPFIDKTFTPFLSLPKIFLPLPLKRGVHTVLKFLLFFCVVFFKLYWTYIEPWLGVWHVKLIGGKELRNILA